MAGLPTPRSPSANRGLPLPAQLQVQYVGFQDAPGRRDYTLMAQLGEKVREYTVSIKLASFEKRQALLQDGPDICYQKLLRELTESELVGAGRLSVTDDDLARYRAAHAPPARRPHARRVFTDTAEGGDDAAGGAPDVL